MIKALLNRLLTPQSTALPNPNTQDALAALMVCVARTDGLYAAEEVERIDKILMELFNLDPFEAAKLRAKAEALESAAADTVRFTRALKASTSPEDRTALMQSLWSIALADGFRDAEEEQQMRLLANLLGLTDVESALARQQAAQQ